MQLQLTTQRLVLRLLSPASAPGFVLLIGDNQIADTTTNIPHPYSEQHAVAFFKFAQQGFAEGVFHSFAISHCNTFVGTVSLALGVTPQAQGKTTAELGYWIGVPYWGDGYATGAAQAVIQYGFEILGLNTIVLRHMLRNPASGRVAEKLGFVREEDRKQAVQRWHVLEDELTWRKHRTKLP